MRVISQDGTIDIPYEQCVIQRFREKIYFLNKNLVGVEQLVNDIEMASYSSEENAQKRFDIVYKYYQITKNIADKDRELVLFWFEVGYNIARKHAGLPMFEIK